MFKVGHLKVTLKLRQAIFENLNFKGSLREATIAILLSLNTNLEENHQKD